MPPIPALTLVFLLTAVPVFAATLGTPTLSPSPSLVQFFDPERLVTTGGVRYSAAADVALEPEWGVVYRASERDFSGGVAESHRLHAQAGWRVSLADTFYLSAAAKLPLLRVDSAELYTGQDLGTRRGYDFTRPFRSTPAWTGELGLHFSPWSDLTLYYDQTPASAWFQAKPQQEERIGTRLILRFQ